MNLLFSLCVLISMLVQLDEQASTPNTISKTRLRWIACLAYNARQTGVTVNENLFESLYSVGESTHETSGEIPGYYFDCLSDTEQYRLGAKHVESKDISQIPLNSVLLVNSPAQNRILPYCLKELSDSTVLLVSPFPTNQGLKVDVDVFPSIWTGYAFTVVEQNNESFAWRIWLGAIGFSMLIFCFLIGKKKPSVIVALFPLALLAGCSDGSGQLDSIKVAEQPTVDTGFTFEPALIELGNFQFERVDKTTAEVRFSVDRTLTLIRFGKSCGCIDISSLNALEGQRLKAGKTYVFSVPITLDRQAGTLRRAVHAIFKDDRGQTLQEKLTITYRVVQPPKLGIPVRKLKLYEGSDIAEGEVLFERLISRDIPPLNLDMNRSDFGELKVSAPKLRPSVEDRPLKTADEKILLPVSLKVAPDLPRVGIKAKICWEGVDQEFDVVLEIEEVHPLECSPVEVFLGYNTAGAKWTFKTRYLESKIGTFRIAGCKSDFESTPEVTMSGNQITLSGNFPSVPGRFEKTATIEFEQASNLPPLSISLAGISREPK